MLNKRTTFIVISLSDYLNHNKVLFILGYIKYNLVRSKKKLCPHAALPLFVTKPIKRFRFQTNNKYRTIKFICKMKYLTFLPIVALSCTFEDTVSTDKLSEIVLNSQVLILFPDINSKIK